MGERTKFTSGDIKAWRCSNGHTMGQVYRNGSGIRRLMLYREALEDAESAAAVDVIAVVEGNVMDVTCSVCGAMRTWAAGDEVVRKMIERARR